MIFISLSDTLALLSGESDFPLSVVADILGMEDLYGLKINSIDGELCLTLDKTKTTTYLFIFDMFNAWQHEAERLKRGEITKEEYDDWRYNYPRIAAERIKAQLDARRVERNVEPTD